jgi:hypothetical protein
MKNQLSKVLYFVSFNLLFLSIYLNFIHRDSNQQVLVSANNKNAATKGTVIVNNPEIYLEKKRANNTLAQIQTSL